MVVGHATVVVGHASMIYLPLYAAVALGSKSESGFDSEDLISATNDCFDLAPLTGVLLCLSISLLCLWQGLVVIFFCCDLRARVSLALLLRWIRKSRVLLFLLSKFLYNFNGITIGGSR